MELLGVLLALAALIWILAGPLVMLGLLARVKTLEEQFQEMRRRAIGPPLPRPATPPLRSARERQPSAAAEEGLEEAIGAVTTRATPLEQMLGSLKPAPAPRLEKGDESISPSRPRPKPTLRPQPSLEEMLGGRWLTWVGAIAVVFGAGFFFKYAIENNWIGETGRVVLGLVLGLVLLTAGAAAMLRDYRFFGQGLAGAALGVLYTSIYAAYEWYRILPEENSIEIAFGAMTVVTMLGIAFSVVFRAQSTAILGLIGGYLTPFLLSTGQDAQLFLFSYILILDFGVLILAALCRWQGLQSVALVGTVVIWASWFDVHYVPAKLELTVTLLTVYFLLFALLGMWHSMLLRERPRGSDLAIMLASPVLYFAPMYAI